MWFVLFLLVTAADLVVDEGKAVAEIPCPEILCELCQAPTAFEVLSMNFLIPGYLLSTSTLLQRQVEELLHATTGTVSVAIGERWLCIQVTEILLEPPLPELYNTMLDIEIESGHRFIESFTHGAVGKVIGRSERTGTGASWEQLQVIYYEVQSELDHVEVYQIREVVHRDLKEVFYFGSMDTVGGGGFIIKTDYDRDNYADIEMVVTNEEDMLGQIQLVLACEEIMSPRGLNSINFFTPFTSLYTYVYGSGEFFISQVIVRANVPDFSTGQGLIITNPLAELTFLADEGKCTMKVIGKCQQGEVEVNSDSEKWSVKVMMPNKSLREIEAIINEFYPDGITILPVYASESQVLNRLYDGILLNPQLFIEYLTEPTIEIASHGKFLTNSDCKIIGYVSRVNSVVESSLFYSDVTEEAMKFIIGLDLSGEILSSTGDTEYEGIEFNSGIQFLCGELAGIYLPGDFYLESEPTNTEVNDLIVISEAKNVYYLEPLLPQMIQGGFQLNIDLENLLDFTVNLTTVENLEEFTGILDSTWENVFGQEFLQISLLKIQWQLQDNFMYNQENLCEAFFTCEETICWVGMCKVVLDLMEFTENAIELSMNPVESDVVFNTLFETDETFLSSCFDFPSVIDIYISLDWAFFETKGFFLGLPSEITGDFDENSSINIEIFPFTLGYGNIRVFNTTSSLEFQLSVTPGSLSGTLNGTFSLWGVTNTVVASINENTFTFPISGFFFAGVYYLNIDVEVIVSEEIQTSQVHLDSSISQLDVDNITALVQEKYFEWVMKGLITLNISESFSVQSFPGENPECQCDPITRCKSPLEAYCVQYSYGVNESEYTTVCESISIFCKNTIVYCLEEETQCVEWMKNIPNTCKTEETSCISVVDICEEWEVECEGSQQGVAAVIETISTDDCFELGYRCNVTEFPDLACESKCIYDLSLYELNADRAEMYQVAFEETTEELQGFFKLDDIEIPFVLTEARLQMDLEKISTGNNELNFTVKAEIYCLDVDELEKFETVLLWNFYSAYENAERVFAWAKGVAIGRSGGTLTADLNLKAPLEVFLENVK